MNLTHLIMMKFWAGASAVAIPAAGESLRAAACIRSLRARACVRTLVAAACIRTLKAHEMKYSPISSATPGGTRDLSHDLTNFLEVGESLTGTQVVTSSSSDLTVGTPTISSDGKKVLFSVTVATVDATGDITLLIRWTGNAGSYDTHRRYITIVQYLDN